MEMTQQNYAGTVAGFAPQVVVLEMRYLLMKNYNYLVVDSASRRAVIVDPAWEMAKIDGALADTQACLSGILITHTHPDHIHLAKPLARKYDCPIWMSGDEIAASGFADGRLVCIDTSPWRIGQMLIHPIFTPGHTPGGICYLIGDNLFTGDTLFAEGCGICPDTQAAHAMFASLEILKSRLQSHTRVFPGHSYGIPPGQPFSRLLRENLYLQFTNRDDFAAYRLRKGQSRLKMFNFS
jgi:hydroxyacylglutathione hydrolase